MSYIYLVLYPLALQNYKMIQSIEIHNFQGHAYTYLELHKGMNVLRGTSHAGKSSVIRAVKWCLFNRPRGEGFKSHFAKTKDPVEVTIVFTEGTYITRKKWWCKDQKRILNSYISDNFEFHAVKNDVPEEVKEITRMTEINFQGQGDRHFLLHESPGAVGKKLSEAVGLQIIDEVKKKLNTVYNDTATRLQVNTEDTEKAEKDQVKYEGLDEVGHIISNIQTHVGNRDKYQWRVTHITNILQRIEQERQIIRDKRRWIECVVPSYVLLKKEIKELDLLQRKHNRIDWALMSIVAARDTIELERTILQAGDKLTSLKTQVDELSILRFKHDKIESVLSDIQKLKKSREHALSTLEILENTKSKLKKQLNFCQSCGADKKHWRKR